MNIIKEGIKTKGKGVKIHNCGRRQLPKFLKEIGCNTGVEVGVQRAYFTKRLCKVGLKVYGIDPWLVYTEYREGSQQQPRQELIYQDALKNISTYSDCTLIRKKSMDVLKDFKDESLDFIYIDGHHGFKYVTEDIYEWSKKVKKGGIISGHDYALKENKKGDKYIIQVKFVIDAYTEAFKIDDWWILGSDEKTFEGEKRDQYRSWFWFKK